ncbi:hypothetical protein M758_4G010300 [Ceratodon purpureus]|nr:hypothetical protein M758_4G010300 [Ceratodon purpureus]
MWKAAPSVVKLWVEAVDACHGPWPGIGCALTDDLTVQTPCSVLNSTCTVVTLKIPNGNLTGEIPLILAGLSNLQHLDLRGNLLNGRVTPELLDSFPMLSFLDLSLNYFTGTIPRARNTSFEYDTWSRNCFSSENSCHLAPQMRSVAECRQQTSLQLQPCVSWTRTHLLLLIVVVLVCPVIVIAALSAIAIYYWRSRSLQAAHFWQLRSSMRADVEEQAGSQRNVCRQFSYQELDAATNSFHQNALLGAGATGFVFQGKLDDGTTVAVKQLDTRNSGMLINDEFWNEVKVRGAIQHPNVVTLRGFFKGIGGSDPMLVCEFMPNGSVLDALLSDNTPLRWPRRYSIAHGAALGLEYLHEHCTPAIIHGNLKPSNILLDRDFTARVGHFGSVRVAKVSQRAVVSTLGFVDPEYGVTGKLTEKSDVFSYGMLLLVLVSGRRMLESQPSGKPQLLTWMQLLAKAELSELVDPRLEGNFDKHEVSLCAQIVLLCTRIQPELRPSMSEVRRILEGIMPVPNSGSLDTPVTSSHTSFVSMSHFSGSFYGTSDSL